MSSILSSLRAPVHYDVLFSDSAAVARSDEQQEQVLERHDKIASASHDQIIHSTLCHLILAASKILRLSVETTFTAAVLLHRYVLSTRQTTPTLALKKDDQEDSPPLEENQMDQEHFRWIVAACLLLACKCEEEPRRLRDIINCALMISSTPSSSLSDGCCSCLPACRGPCSKHQQQHGAVSVLFWNPVPPILDDNYWNSKTKLVHAEQHVLRWLAFDVSVSHPHRAVVLFLQDFADNHKNITIKNSNMENQQQQETGDVINVPSLIAACWRRLNDAVFSIVALQHPAWLLAIAAIRLEVKGLEEEEQHQPSSPPPPCSLLDLQYYRQKYGFIALTERELETVQACLLAVSSSLSTLSSPS